MEGLEMTDESTEQVEAKVMLDGAFDALRKSMLARPEMEDESFLSGFMLGWKYASAYLGVTVQSSPALQAARDLLERQIRLNGMERHFEARRK